VISSAVTNAMALMKNHMPNFDAEILQRDFTVDEEEREALVDSTYDIAHYFVTQYDFFILPESDNNASHGTL
jgi:hypothetical protein